MHKEKNKIANNSFTIKDPLHYHIKFIKNHKFKWIIHIMLKKILYFQFYRNLIMKLNQTFIRELTLKVFSFI